MSRRDRDRDRHRERERETREPDTKRRRSGFDQEPPSVDGERPRKDVEAVPVDDNRSRRRFHDALPPPDSDSKPKPEQAREVDPKGGEEGKKEAANGRGNEEARRNEDSARGTRSRSYFQHDERSNAGQVGRSSGSRATSDRYWRDSKVDRSDRTMNNSAANDSKWKDEKLPGKRDGSSVWCHDGFFRMEAEQPPLPRKRPAFREKKTPLDSEHADRAAIEPGRSSHLDRLVSSGKDREERDINEPRPVDKTENPTGGDRRDVHRSIFSSRERYSSSNGNYRQRERFDGNQGYRPTGTRGDKWKHDLFEEANKSPASRKEEDQIAKVEQLLAS